MGAYARTSVTVEKSQAEIRKLLVKHAAAQSASWATSASTATEIPSRRP
jgi:hypothetical protein